jgi:hypothetical protein
VSSGQIWSAWELYSTIARSSTAYWLIWWKNPEHRDAHCAPLCASLPTLLTHTEPSSKLKRYGLRIFRRPVWKTRGWRLHKN